MVGCLSWKFRCGIRSVALREGVLEFSKTSLGSFEVVDDSPWARLLSGMLVSEEASEISADTFSSLRNSKHKFGITYVACRRCVDFYGCRQLSGSDRLTSVCFH